MKKRLLILVAILSLVAIMGGNRMPDPSAINLGMRFSNPSIAHVLGTDELGRDVLSRVIHGGWSVLALAVGVVVVSAVLGLLISAGAIRSGGYSRMISFLSETVLLVPDILIIMFGVSMLGAGVYSLAFALSMVFVPRYVRIIKGSIVRFRNEGYMLSLRARGVRESRVITRHLLPLVLRQVVVQSAYNIGGTIFVTSTLGFLGIGLDASAIEWGNMIRSSMPYLLVHPMPVVTYGVSALFVSYLCNSLGEGLKQSLRRYEYAT